MHDVIAGSPLVFCHAKINSGGYISINQRTFHRGMIINEFDSILFDSLDEAVEELPNYDGETFVMAFPENDVCDRLWFMPEQKENGLTKRLEYWKACYSGYPTAIYRKK